MGTTMRRLHQLGNPHVNEWRQARDEWGRQKYGDAHMDRYLTVDVAEEILDAITILERLEERLVRQGVQIDEVPRVLMAAVRDNLQTAFKYLHMLDRFLPDEVCTDGKGGHRIWWSEFSAGARVLH